VTPSGWRPSSAVSSDRIGAAALSLALAGAVAGAVLLLVHASHPPADTTLLIVGPDVPTTIMLGVVILTVAGWVINRALEVSVPYWASSD
jgi:hypothetical protein